jgi:hypothetical protein
MQLQATSAQFKAEQFERSQDRQRQGLESLQSALVDELTAADDLIREKDRCNENSSTMGWAECGDDTRFVHIADGGKKFRGRVRNDRIRQLSKSMDRLCNDAARSKNKKEADLWLTKARKVHDEVDELIGTVWRSQYTSPTG